MSGVRGPATQIAAVRSSCWAVSIALVLFASVAAPGLAAASLELRADSLIADAAAQTIDARGRVRISDGRVVATAARALYFLAERRLLLSGGVTVTSPDGSMRSRQAAITLSKDNTVDVLDAQGAVSGQSRGRALRADRVIYRIPTGQVTAVGHVFVSSPSGITATGREMTADLRQQTGVLMQATVLAREGTVRSDRLEVAAASQQAVLRGHVAAAFQQTRITAETATVFERERKIVFRGAVRLSRPGRMLAADTLTFYYVQNRLVAEGETHIIIQETP